MASDGRVVIVGAGLAGLRTAERLRARGFAGPILLAGSEDTPPYDRPPLSKEVLTGAKDPAQTVLRSPEHLASLEIELRLAQTATALDLRSRTLRIGLETISFDQLVVATGARARTVPLGGELAGIQTLRTIGDAADLRAELLRRPRVVIVGAGFIGAEVASSARALGLEVAIVEAALVPLSRAFGPRLGELSARLHRDHGTALICGATLTAIEGRERVEAVRLSDGRTLACDLLVVGIGVVPNVEWLACSGLHTDNGLVCDDRLNAGHPTVFAAGDVARWPNPLFRTWMRAEQWTNAVEQARLVADNLLAAPEGRQPFRGLNYFWSDQYGVRIQFAGISDAESVRVVCGDTDSYKFVAHYARAGRLVGALAMNSPRELMRSKALIERGTAADEAAMAVRG